VLPLELEEALEHGGAVEMEYVDAGNQRTNRVVRPLQIRRFKGETMLVAHCELRGERRNFKVDRIVTLRRVEIELRAGGQAQS
jgi:predicted DNA-binding transcriptional regulator YafY